jgi:hypothetical protein
MARPKAEKHSVDVDAEIRRLEQEKRRLVIAEDQRRGAIIRECLRGEHADELRSILRPIVAPRDSFLFGIEQPARSAGRVEAANETERPTAVPNPSRSVVSRQAAVA